MNTYSSKPDDTTGYDTYINSSTPNTNNNSTILIVGEGNTSVDVARTLIKFDLSSIPANAVIQDATLSLWFSTDISSNARTMRAYRVLRNWVEAQATWNIYSTGNNWGTAGCANTTTDREATDIGSVSVSASETPDTEKQISLTASKVQEWVSGTTANYGLLIQMDTESNDAYAFHSSGGATAGYRPKLVINYTVPVGNPVTYISEFGII